MDNRERSSTTPGGDIWPPPPLRDEPLPLFLRVEGMEIRRNGDRLVVLNSLIRGLFLVEACLLGRRLLSPWPTYWNWTRPFHQPPLSGWLLSVIASYRHNYATDLFELLMIAGVWCLFIFLWNLDGVTLDRQQETVKTGGRRARPMSGIGAVVIKRTHTTLFRTRYCVQLVWSDGSLIKTYFLGLLSQEANAEKVAAMVAEFAGVPVRHQPRRKNSV